MRTVEAALSNSLIALCVIEFFVGIVIGALAAFVYLLVGLARSL
jgi:hypothetical protein